MKNLKIDNPFPATDGFDLSSEPTEKPSAGDEEGFVDEDYDWSDGGRQDHPGRFSQRREIDPIQRDDL